MINKDQTLSHKRAMSGLIEEFVDYCVGLVGGTRGLDDAGRLRLSEDLSSRWEDEVNNFLFDESKRTILVRLVGDSNDLCVGTDGLSDGELQSTLVVLKNKRSVDYNVPIRSQFSVMWLSDSSMIDSLTSLIDGGLSTVIDLLIQQESGTSESLRMTKSKLKNVSYTLRNMQYTICTPAIISLTHPRIQDLLKEGKQNEADVDPKLLTDTHFLNALQSIANQWLELSSGLCNTDRDVRDGSAYDEIQYWSDLQKSLMSLAQQLRSPEVRSTVSILVATKRWNSVSGFVAETGVTDRLKIVSEYNQFISSIPLKSLSSVEKVEDVEKCIELLASALKKFRFTSFPEERFALFMGKISQEVQRKLLEVVPNLFTATDGDFNDYKRIVLKALVNWNDVIQENKIQLREVIRRRGHSFSTAIDIRPNADDLQGSLRQLSEFRDRNAVLRASLETIRYDGYLQDLEFLFEPIDILCNTSIASWNKEQALYRQRLSVMEEKLIVVWRTALDQGSSSEEMIDQYTLFAPLMVSHPKLRSVMRDCQEGLLSIVKQEIKALGSKVEGMHHVEEVLMLKGLTPVTALILECIQIRDRISIVRKRSGILLGLNWETLPEGRALSSSIAELMQRIDCTAAFGVWKEKALQLNLEKLDTPMLKVFSSHKDHYELSVNFDFSAGSIFKEVRYLGSMGFDIPNSVIRTSLKFGDIHCRASIILEQLQTFLSVVSGLDSRTYTAVLLRKNVDAVWRLIGKATVAVWSNSTLDQRSKDHEDASFSHIKDLEMAVSLVLKNFEVLEESEMLLERAFEALINSPSNTKLAFEAIASIQSILVGMSTLQFEALSELNSHLNRRIEEIILCKTRQELKSMRLGRQALIVTLKGRSLSFSPELSQIKSSWIRTIEQTVTKVAGQPKLYLKCSNAQKETFSNLTESLSGTVVSVLKRLEKEYQKTKSYLEDLKMTEVLWLLKDSDLHDTIRADITVCYKLWEQLALLRNRLERPPEAYNFNGLLIFRFEDSLTQIFGKLDHWQKLLCEVLLVLYLDSATTLISDLRRDLEELEGYDDKISSFEHFSSLLIYIHRMRSHNSERRKSVKLLSLCEPVFLETRLKLPTEYPYIDQLENDMRAAEDCLEEKEALLETKRTLIITILEDKLTSINSHIRMVLNDWRMKQSILHEELPREALNILLSFETSLANINEEVKVVSLCSRIILHPIVFEGCLKKVSDEVQESIIMCKRLGEILGLVDDLMQEEWASVNVDTVSREVETFTGTIKSLSSNFRQYQLFEELETRIRKLKGCMGLLKEMKSSAMKPRHWKAIFAKSSQTTPPAVVLELQTFSLKEIVSLNMKADEAFLKEIMYSAQREGVLEESLCIMQAFWKNAQYENFEHSSGMALVKDWVSIQQSCSDDLDELIAMKSSICFKFFEHDCTELELKLAAFLEIQHNWMEAQFHWLDLYSVVGTGGKLSILLPHEAAKFHNVTSDLRAISSRAFQMGSIIELTSLSGGKKKFKDLLDRLKVIKSSLTDYLEQQRRNYPRYFFLGNGDLLKLLGTGSDLEQMARYMPKLFGSISRVQFAGSIITGICSIEGEILNLDTPVSVEEHSADVWLANLELEIKKTISKNVHFCLLKIAEGLDFTSLLYSHSFQVLLLTWQVLWTQRVDRSIEEGEFSGIQQDINRQLDFLLKNLKDCRGLHNKQKARSLIVECIHGAAVVTKLRNASSVSMVNLVWSKTQKFYFQYDEPDLLERVIAVQCGRQLKYGFTYIGVPERLIYTSTLDQSFAALGEALSQKYGGCLFGPAGTGKTETIKALAQNLGRMVLVFNCDKSFDFQAMSRLLLGIAQVGAWGCFDELNRMNEATLSSVTSHVERIQLALLEKCDKVHVMNQSVPLNADAGLFITLNPGYGGRSVLPENLKKRFREYSMRKAETDTISEVIMRTMGFNKAHTLSEKLVCFFEILRRDCSTQKHYDFGLRSFKKVFKTCAELAGKREHQVNEECLLAESMSQIILPSLNKADEVVYMSHANRLFSHHELMIFSNEFNENLLATCQECFLEPTKEFVLKCAQLFNIQRSQQAIILMGAAGFGKTAVWRTTMMTMKKLGGLGIFAYVIDTKTLTKDSLYGKLNKATLEWKDGVFTSILRKVNDDLTGAFKDAMVWVVFDSDLDPEYIEVLNSALDDNKLLTLPTGERIAMPENLRLLFEAPNLHYATPATITRCAIIWFPEPLYAEHEQLNCSFTKSAQEAQTSFGISEDFMKHMGLIFKDLMSPVDFSRISSEAKLFHHILAFDSSRTVTAISKIITHGIRSFHDLLLVAHDRQKYVFTLIRLYQTLINAMAADISSKDRKTFIVFIDTIFGNKCRELLEPESRPESLHIMTRTLEPIPFNGLVEQKNLEPHDVMKPDIFIPTLDTLKQESYVFDLLNAGQPVILCGPPGSGKTMILTNALQKSAQYLLVGINFSKDTTISSILKTLKRHTKYADGPKGLVLCPKLPDRCVVLFCDEINLAKLDMYGSQSVILFLRLLIEKSGFWRTDDNRWVSIERIRIVGACNPSSDPGRLPMSPRFLRHTPILLIDYPSAQSLMTIYQSLFEATFHLVPHLKSHAKTFCEASLHLYHQCRKNFTPSMQAHYLFSPRELTRWIRGLHTAIIGGLPQDFVSLLHAWAYEASRIFADRLVEDTDTQVFLTLLRGTSNIFFANHGTLPPDLSKLLFSSLLSHDYKQVQKVDLLAFVKQRLSSFAEEQMESQLIIHEEMLDQILAIDRVLKQPQGHAMLIGARRTGKTTLVKFVSWINGLTVLQPAIHKDYDIHEFDAFLRKVLLRCTVDGQRVCLIIDESSILESSFLERMNTLLANSDVPDLFQEEQYESLIISLRLKSSTLGLALDSDQELYDWFVGEISKNLHVVFTICNPCGSESTNLTASPALFNRCVINWMGSWSTSVLRQISNEIIQSMSLEFSVVAPSEKTHPNSLKSVNSYSNKISNAFVKFHINFHVKQKSTKSPGVFLDALKLFKKLHIKKGKELAENQRFYSNGLQKLDESVLKFEEMNVLLTTKEKELKTKETEARQTLDKMLVEQNEAERKQEATLEIKTILTQRESEASQRRQSVRAELDAFEPVMLEAQRGVKNIKKQQLTEIRSMTNPPITVKITIEAVCSVLGYRSSSWRNIQQFIRSDEFIYDIVHFDPDTMLPKHLKIMIENEFLSLPDFTYEKVHRASKACGPLYQWVYAQIKYSEVLENVGPLRDEAKQIEEEALLAKARLLAAEDMISELEEGIKNLKDTYRVIIRDIEIIKSNMEEVQAKLDRSKALVENLSSERSRWEQYIENYQQELEEINGNCLITALHTSYCGVLNEKQRKQTFGAIADILDDLSIRFDRNYQFVAHNIDVDTQARWISHGLPNETFYMENFLLALESDVIPYIVDPNYQVPKILSSFFQGRLEVLSFGESNFVKKFANAVKFGGTVLVQSAEFFDPIVNNVVAGVCRKSHGHRIVKIGDLEIDVSPEFRMLLCSNDTRKPLSNFVQSRVRVVDFSINEVSVEMQAVRMALTCDAPEVERENEELSKLNGTYKVRLKKLEHQLLEELNHSKGNILENDELITTLERVKAEAMQVEGKLQKNHDLIEKIASLTTSYSTFGYYCSSLYSMLKKFSRMHWFFELPLWLFLDCLKAVLVPEQVIDSDPEKRVESLCWRLYQRVYSTFSAYITKDYRMVLAVSLHLMFIFPGDIKSMRQALKSVLNIMEPETARVRDAEEEVFNKYSESFKKMIELISNQAYLPAIELLVNKFPKEETLENMASSGGKNYIVLATERDIDCSFKVIELAKKQKKELSVIALGSPESERYAEQEVIRSMLEGGWLLLQNGQMSMSWVVSFLARKMEQQSEGAESPRKQFKIFITCNLLGEMLPLPLLQDSHKKVYESTPSILGSVCDLWSNTSLKSEIESKGSVLLRLIFLLAWFHAIIEARSRLNPIGFTKKYDFNECDFESGISNLVQFASRVHDESELFDCAELHFTIGRIIYGGKVDEDEDLAVLQNICSQIFSSEAIESLQNPNRSHELLPGVSIPLGFVDEQVLSDILNKSCEPIDSYSSWLGLPANAIQQYERIKIRELLIKTEDLLTD